MNKKILLIIVMLAVTVTSHGDSTDSRKVQSAQSSTKASSISFPGTAPVYSHSFPIASIPSEESFAIMYLAAGTTINGRIEFQQSYTAPATEGSFDSAFLTSHVVDTSITTAQWEMATIDNVSMYYGRFIVQGQSTNGLNSTMQIKVVKP